MTLSTIQEVNGLLIYDLIFAKGHERDKEKRFVAFRPPIYTFFFFLICIQGMFEDTGVSFSPLFRRKCGNNLKSIN